MLLHFPPFFSVQLESHQEPEVLILRPATHTMLMLHITLLVLVALTLEVRLITSLPRSISTTTCQIFSKILVRKSATSNFTGWQLGRVLLESKRIRLAECLVDVTVLDRLLLVLLVDLGLSCCKMQLVSI